MSSAGPIPHADEAALAICADALAAARPLSALSAGLTLVAALGVAVAGAFADAVVLALVTWSAALATGLGAQWLVYRIALDARLFARLAADAAQGRFDWARFDATMLRLDLMPPGKAAREADARCRGALGLVRALGVAIVAQAALVVVGGVALASTAS